MKQCLLISAILLLVLAFCISGASAQTVDQGAGMQDDPPGQMNMKCGGMMHEGMKCGGMMHEGMMHEGMKCGGMMHEGMKCGGMMHEGMMHEGMMHEGMTHEGMTHEGMMERQHRMKMMLMRLGLDERQQAQVDEIMAAHMKDVIKKNADLDIAKVDLKTILSKDPIEMRAAESKLNEISAIKTSLFLSHLTAHQQIKSILTPEQQTKMKEMMKMHMMGGGMMGKGGCGCEMMKGEMEGKEHHEHEKMMK